VSQMLFYFVNSLSNLI